MGRLELKLLSLLLLLTGLPMALAFFLLGTLFERSLDTGLNPALKPVLEDAVQIYGRFIRSEKARQRALAKGLAESQGLREAAETGPLALDAWLRPAVEAPRVFSISLIPPVGPALELNSSLKPTPEAWLQAEELLSLEDVQGYHQLRYRYGLERSFQERFKVMDEEVIRPFMALMADRENLAEVYAWSFIAYLALILSIAAGVALLVARRITQRLSLLKRALMAVAQGEMGIQLPPEGRDEISDLSQGFNEMSLRLKESQARVQQLIQVSAWQGIARKLAHEIKNPLTPILLAVQQAHQSHHGEDQRHQRTLDTMREVVEEEVHTLRRLVENFSRFARLPEAQLEPLDLSLLVQDLASAHPEVEELLLELPQTPVMVLGDRSLLRQVLTNLIKNAVEACAELQSPTQIKLRVWAQPSPSLSVEDNGPGVLEEQRERIFEPYVTGKAEGTGLGLAIVRKIILDHQGSLEVESAEEGGARFLLRFPGLC